MKFKIKKLLTDRQLYKAKFSMFMGLILCVYLLTAQYFVRGQEEEEFNAEEYFKDYVSTETAEFERGRIVYYSKNTEVCNR